MLLSLDAGAVRRWCEQAREDLSAARVEIDELNVFPVPDGDTGTNLLLTMEAVELAVRQAPADDLPATARAMASGALLGARGNSGVILSQLLRGLAEAWQVDGSAAGLRSGLVRGAELARAGVARPVEGTLLSVAHDCAAAATACEGDLVAVVRAARDGAAASLARTTSQLKVLEDAGVVDAGGRGLCVLLEALERVVTGAGPVPASAPALLVPRERSAVVVPREAGAEDFAYEVQYLLRDSGEEQVARLTEVLASLGDCLAVVGGAPSAPGVYNVHVHVNDVGAAIEAGLDAGRPFRITVTRFADQGGRASTVAREAGRAVVAVAHGAGLAALFRDSGAQVVEAGEGPGTTDALLDAVRASSVAEVVLLPDAAEGLADAAAAASAARAEGFAVAVVPTRSSVQRLAALAVADPARPFADDVAAMAEAAGSTRSGEVTLAVREAVTMAGICAPGDVLGLLDGDVVRIGGDLETVARHLLDRLLGGGGELVTLITGAGAGPQTAARLADWLAQAHPTVEVVTYDGGSPSSPLLLGVE